MTWESFLLKLFYFPFRYLEVSISEWLMERSAGFAERKEAELVARPLLRWLDRKIEDMMTEALKQVRE